MTRQEKEKIADPKIVTDAVDVAEEAGLRYVSHDQPGYSAKPRATNSSISTPRANRFATTSGYCE
jgi:hypothetical protein